jgi:FkbM family methyltransferase
MRLEDLVVDMGRGYAWQRWRHHRRDKRGPAGAWHGVVQTPLGVRFEVDTQDVVERDIYRYGAFELPEIRLIEALVRRTGRNRTFVDVGANVGNHALSLAGSFETVVAVDPNPDVLQRLRRNIALNGAHNVLFYPRGLSNRAATLPFIVNRASLALSRFADNALGASKGERFEQPQSVETRLLEVTTGDAMVAALGLTAVDVVKIDVEFHELEVIEGMAETLLRHRPLLLFEWNGRMLKREQFGRVRELLPGYAFYEYWIPKPSRKLSRCYLSYLMFGCRYRLRRIDEVRAEDYPLLVAAPAPG